jgi:hypothetical protein
MQLNSLPTWIECSNKSKAFGPQSLNPLERFIYDYEPSRDDQTWRADLTAVLQFPYTLEKLPDACG